MTPRRGSRPGGARGRTARGSRAVGLPAVGDHPRARLDVLKQKRAQRLGGSVGNRDHPTAPESHGFLALDRHSHHRLVALPASAPRAQLLAADVGLIDLDRAPQPLAAGAHQHRAQPMQHRPGRLVGADLERPPQRQRRDSVLLAGEQPAGRTPLAVCASCRRWCTPSARSAHGTHDTRSARRPAPKPWNGRTPGTRNRRATVASPGSTDSQHRSQTTASNSPIDRG